ncbi:MAG: AAA family ATPase [Lachnospiraceae bacterium]|nr:AAA family ATPase [Lachnospiraceae bacterium]
MDTQQKKEKWAISRQAEERYLKQTLAVVQDNLSNYGQEVSRMQEDIDVMLAHYHDNDTEVLTILNNTVTMHEHMKRALLRNEKALNKPYFGRIIFHDEALDKEESIYIGKGGIAKDTTHFVVVDWRAPVANAYYENGLGKCSYEAPGGTRIRIDLKLKRTYEIESGRLLDYFDSEVIANDDLLTKYLAKNKQAVLSEIVATIQKEQNEIIRKSPYHNIIVQGVAGSGKTTVAMHRISYILYNYEERFKPDDFYIVGSNRILLNYITGVLPDLDVYGIRQMTMEQLFVRLLYEDWDDKKYRIKAAGNRKKSNQNRGADDGGKDESIKGSSTWFHDLEEYCRKLEWSAISRKTVYLNPKQFVEGIRNGKAGVFDESSGRGADMADLICLMDGDAVERYIRENPTVSVQSKINMLNTRLRGKAKEEFLKRSIRYTEAERKAILKAYRGYYGGKIWKQPIFELYREFLLRQTEKGYDVSIPEEEFDVYDLAALAYLYKRVKETEVISEAHHIVIDEAQDFGMMAYLVLKFCIYRCTYTVMGDVSQNIHFGYGLNDWEELKELILADPMDSFGILKKSYRNTVEISEFATNILHHGRFSIYPVEPIIRHGSPVQMRKFADRVTMIRAAADICIKWQTGGGKSDGSDNKNSGESDSLSRQNSGSRLDTIAVVCRDQDEAAAVAKELSRYVDVMESDPEKTQFGSGIMVLPVEYTKGLEFDAVLILDPSRDKYPTDDGHAKLLYVAATRALHELCVLHTGNLTGLIADPVPDEHVVIEAGLPSDKTDSGDNRKRVTNPPSAAGVQSHNRMKKKVSIVRNQSMDEGVEEKKKAYAGRKVVNREVAGGLYTADGHDRRTAEKNDDRTADKVQRTHINVHGKGIEETKQESLIQFGDMPATEKLRPAGHGKIDLAVKWVVKQQDGLYLHSRYGVLRLSPIGSAIIRVTFAKGGQIVSGENDKIAVNSVDKRWMYKESGSMVELMTDELLVQVDKGTGAIRYMTRDKKLLLAERNKECRQLEGIADGRFRTWLYLDWQKKETVYGMGAGDVAGLNLRKTARYISHIGSSENEAFELPFILSDQGYGIVLAADSPAMSCDIPTYGSYLYTESERQMDFYFITGKRQNTIMNAYAYLCGKL